MVLFLETGVVPEAYLMAPIATPQGRTRVDVDLVDVWMTAQLWSAEVSQSQPALRADEKQGRSRSVRSASPRRNATDHKGRRLEGES